MDDNTILMTKVETYKLEKICDSCIIGKMVSTGSGVTRGLDSFWEHKCSNCSKIETYDKVYPTLIYK